MSYLSLDQFALMPNLRGFFIAQFLDFRFGLFMRPKKIKGSAQDNSGRILAIDLTPGLNLWKLEIRRNGQNQHGITYDNGVIFAGTGKNTTLLALNPTDGKVIWQTIPAGDPNKNYITQGPPTVWKNIALIGHATSSGPINPDLKGKVTAFNRTNGEKLCSLQILLVLGYSMKMLPKTEVHQYGLDEH